MRGKGRTQHIKTNKTYQRETFRRVFRFFSFRDIARRLHVSIPPTQSTHLLASQIRGTLSALFLPPFFLQCGRRGRLQVKSSRRGH